MIFLNSLEVNKQKYPTGFLQSMYETQKYPIENKRNVYKIYLCVDFENYLLWKIHAFTFICMRPSPVSAIFTSKLV